MDFNHGTGSEFSFQRFAVPMENIEGDFSPASFEELHERVKAGLGNRYVAFDSAVEQSVEGFFGVKPDVVSLLGEYRKRRLTEDYGVPTYFVNLYRTPQGDIAVVDVEQHVKLVSAGLEDVAILEIDVFCFHKDQAHASEIVEAIKAAAGLKGSTVPVPRFERTRATFLRLKDLAKTRGIGVGDAAVAILEDPQTRALLAGLKERRSLLGTSAGDLVEGVPADFALETLTKMSNDGTGLVELRYAVLCNRTRDLLFLASSEEQLAGLSDLECHRCGCKFVQEKVELFFRPTEALKAVIDGGKWLPLSAKRTLEKAGVPKDDILVNSVIEGDEFDLVCLIHDCFLVGESKSRQISLGDVYKFAAKISHFQGSIRRKLLGNNVRGREMLSDDEELVFVEPSPRAPRVVPVMITTQEIDKDAAQFLKDTLGEAFVILRADDCLENALTSYVGNVRLADALDYYERATSFEHNDSIARLAAFIVESAATRLKPIWETETQDGTSAPR